MRVGFFYDRMESVGGVENYLLWTAAGLSGRGHATHVFCEHAADAIAARYAAAGVPLRTDLEGLRDMDVANVHNFPASLKYRQLAQVPPAVLSLHEPPRHLYEEEMDFHFVHSHLNRERKPWTRWWDRAAHRRDREADQKAVRSYPVVVADSRYIASKIQEIYGRSDARVVPFGIPDPPADDAETGPVEPGYLLAIARLTIVKNIQTAIAAVQQVAGARLVVVGDGDERTRLERMADPAVVRFAGRVGEADKARLLRDCAAVVHLPLDEPFGLVALEAGQYGKPVVGSNHGGVAEIVEHDVTGMLVDPTQAAAAATAIRLLVEHPEQARRMGERGRERVHRLYSHARYLDEMEAVLQAAASSSALLGRTG